MIRLLYALIPFVAMSTGWGQTRSDSLYDQFYVSSNWDEKARTAYQFARLNIAKKPESCMEMYRLIEQNLPEVTDQTALFNTFNCKAIIYQYRSDYDSAEIYLDKCETISKLKGDTVLIMKNLQNKGLNYRHLGDYKKSIAMGMKSLDLSKHVGDELGQANALAEIGNAYLLLEEYETGKEYHQQAFKLFQNNDDVRGMGSSCSSISHAFDKTGHLDSALYYTEKGMAYSLKSGHMFQIANAYRTKCGFLLQMDAPDEEVLDCSLAQLEYDRQIQNKEGIMLGLLQISKVLNNMKRFEESIQYTNQALEMANRMGKLREKLEIFKSLAIRYENISSFEKAYQFMDSAYYYQDVVRGMDVQAQTLELNEKYQTAEKDRIILEEKANALELEKKNAAAQLVISNRNKWIYGISGGTLALVFLGLLLLQRNKRKAQQDKDAALLEERDRSLQAVIDAQEEERKRISKDLHDGIGQQLSGLKMAWSTLSQSLQGADQQKIEELTSILTDSADEVRSISHQMMPRSLQELGLVPAIEDMLEKSFRYSEIAYRFDHFKANKRYNERLEISLYRVCQELINNVIKHSNASEVSVQLIRTNQFLSLIVEDNGRGMGTGRAEGHGLQNISARLGVIKGQVSYAPSEESGTLATVRIPIS